MRWVDADHRSRMTPRQVLGDGAAPIAPMCAELLVTEFVGHQFAPQVAEPEQSPPAQSRLGEGISGQAWRDDIKRVRGVPAMGCGIGQQGYQFVKATEGIGITMRQNKRQRRWPPPFFMNQMKGGAIYDPPQMAKAIKPGFLRPPIVAIAPVVDKLA